MASRTEQKARARAERVAREQAAAAAASKRQRLLIIGGVFLLALIVAGVAIGISSSRGGAGTQASAATKPTSKAALSADRRVDSLLADTPEQSDNVLGKASAPITITEYGDLECSVCDSLALGSDATTSAGSAGSGVENEVIDKLVKTGKAKLVYASLDTATSNGVTPDEFVPQQMAADAAGLQGKAWYYIELFYNEQGAEGTDYVNQSYLDGIAKQVPGLNYAQWLKDSSEAKLKTQVADEIAAGTKVDNGAASTPTVVVSGARGETIAAEGLPTYSQIQTAISTVE